MSIKIQNISKSYGEKKVFKGFSLELPEMGVVTLFGPSGCGKTTLINIIAGIEKEYTGKILGIEGKRISVVFQEDRLLPWADINKNLSLAAVSEDDSRVAELLDLMELQDVGEKHPHELSGGMKRRIAIARALIFGGDIYLLDEPFKGLDMDIKEKIMDHFKKVAKTNLIILITHDHIEAEYLSDEIYDIASLLK